MEEQIDGKLSAAPWLPEEGMKEEAKLCDIGSLKFTSQVAPSTPKGREGFSGRGQEIPSPESGEAKEAASC